jgi:hypothetical protein
MCRRTLQQVIRALARAAHEGSRTAPAAMAAADTIVTICDRKLRTPDLLISRRAGRVDIDSTLPCYHIE